MVRTDIFAFGKLTENFAVLACERYLKLLRPYTSVNVTELAAERLYDESASSVSAALRREADTLSSRLDSSACLVAMCVEGEKMSSERLSSYISERMNAGVSRFQFVIGSSHGLDESVKKKAALRLSMSDMTFPHELARVMLTEQLYRAFSIMNGGKYHK